jgi:UrcA family protein
MSKLIHAAARTAACLICALVAGQAALAAGSFGEPLSVTVHYADLNLGTSAGVAALYGRIRSAATVVCVPYKGQGLAQDAVWHKCIDNAMSRAVAEVHRDVVTAYYLQRNLQRTGTVALAQR